MTRVVQCPLWQPWLERKLKIHDTCGVHNLHGMPGVMGTILRLRNFVTQSPITVLAGKVKCILLYYSVLSIIMAATVRKRDDNTWVDFETDEQ